MAGTAVVLQLISLFFCCVSGAILQYDGTRLSASAPNVTLTVGMRERVYCLQPVGPVPTAIEWYNPQGQLVSRDGGDEVNQAGGGGRAAFLNFQSQYQKCQGGTYECRVTGPGNNLEKLSVCIGPTYRSCAAEVTATSAPTEPLSTSVPIAEPPSKVVGVRVTPGVQYTFPTLTVAWQAVAGGAVRYTIKYSTQPGEVNIPPEGALAVKGISGTSTILTVLERGTTYYIWVVGVSEGGEGPHSDRMSGLTYDVDSEAKTIDSISATAVGLFLGGVVAGALGVLLIVGIVVGACRLRRTKHKSSLNSKAAGEEVSMGANPAYEVNCKI